MEEHYVKTEDNFTLGVQRIPRGRTQAEQPLLKPVVFLQHGLLADASTWVQNYPHNSLGYILADSGFDVWLGNERGNRYSRHNTVYKPCQREFWDWRWVWVEWASVQVFQFVDAWGKLVIGGNRNPMNHSYYMVCALQSSFTWKHWVYFTRHK